MDVAYDVERTENGQTSVRASISLCKGRGLVSR